MDTHMPTHMLRRSRALVFVAGVTGVLLLLSGCAGASSPASPTASAPTPARTPTASASAPEREPTSAPSSTPSPAADAVRLDAPESWLIGFTSVGPLNVGDEIATASQAMTAFTGTSYDGCPAVVEYVRPDAPTVLIPDRLGTGMLEQIVLQGGADPSGLAGGTPHTTEGIGIGSSLDAVLTAYPTITYQEDRFTPHWALTDGNGNWINILVTDNVVSGIVVRSSPVVAKEYCS